MDLVDEMQWEDTVEFVSLEDAGLEEPQDQPIFGGENPMSNGIYSYTEWFYDADDSAFSII